MSSKFYGKDSDKDTIRKHIIELKTGNPSKGIDPLNVTDIAKKLGVSRETVYQYLKTAKQNEEVSIDEDGKIEVNKHQVDSKNFKTFTDAHPITEDENVKSWISAMRTMGHTGQGVKSAKSHIQGVQKLCNHLKISPIQLTIDFQTSEKYAQNYYDGLIDGTIPRRNLRQKSSPLGAFYSVRMGLRHFMQYNGRHAISVPRGYNGVLSGRIIGHGNYADIDMSDEEILEVEKYIIQTWGLDSDIYRVFFIGIESCARKEALLSMKLEWTEDKDEDDEITYFMQAIEKKTEHIMEGKMDKFIQRKNTQESLRLAKKRGLKHLWDSDNVPKTRNFETLTSQLKQIYEMLGKTSHYWYEEAFHSLRHVGAHYHLRSTDYNYGYVAVIGGWNVIDECKKSYGKMPPSVLMRLMKKSRRGIMK